jgi:chemotaxis protein MotA
MDIGTIIGIVSGVILLFFAIVLGGDVGIFINIPSVLIVCGGMIAAVFVMNPLTTIISAFKIVINAFTTKPLTAPEIIEKITELTLKARKNGTLSLESEVVHNKFLGKGIRYVVDGVDPSIIEMLMNIDIAHMKQRHKIGSKLFKSFGTFAPAFGMIGTLIGLVQMLQTLDDPSSIGPAMAVALLTTFYGAVMANLIFIPISEKLSIRSDEETLVMRVIMEGVLSLVAGDNPKIVQEKLETYLPPKLRKIEQELAARED